jgi:HEAT repeat protein
LACIGLVRAAASLAEDDLVRATQRPRGRGIGVKRDTGAVLHNTHLKLIAALVVVTFLTVTLVDYQFKVVARTAFGEEGQLAAFFGNFYGVGGIVACLVQFFLTGRIIDRAGSVGALFVLPGTMALGVLSMGLVPLVPALLAATLAKGAENIFRYTVNDATSQVLYAPVPTDRRGRAKAFIDGILKPCAIGVAGLSVFLLGREADPTDLALDLAWVDGALLLAWMGVVLRMKKAYVHSLLDSLQDRRVDFGAAWTPAMDERTIATLRERLAADDEEEVLHALEIATKVEADFRPQLESLLDHPSNAIRIAALRHLGRRRRFESIAAVRGRLHDPHPEVRAAAVEAFCAIGRERAIRAVTPHLMDEDLEVRGAACSALILHSGLDGILAVAESLKGLLTGQTADERLQGARVLGKIQVKSFFHALLELFEDPSSRVRLAAVEAAGHMRSPELVPALIYKLADPVAGRAAVRALASYGADVEATLFRVLAQKAEALEVRRRVPAVLGMIGGAEALSALVAVLDTRDPELRAAAAREAARIRERTPRAHIDDDALSAALRRELRGAYQTLATIEDLGLDGDDLLLEALEVRLGQKLSLVFRLLEVRYPGRAVRLVSANLSAESRVVRANALEVAENILSREESRLLLPLLEEIPRPSKVERGEEHFELRHRSAEAWLPLLIEDPHPWTVACALRVIAARGLTRLAPRVMELTQHRDPTIRETAFFTLAELTDSERSATRDLERLARSAAVDPAHEVRRAGAHLLEALGLRTPTSGSLPSSA